MVVEVILIVLGVASKEGSFIWISAFVISKLEVCKFTMLVCCCAICWIGEDTVGGELSAVFGRDDVVVDVSRCGVVLCAMAAAGSLLLG